MTVSSKNYFSGNKVNLGVKCSTCVYIVAEINLGNNFFTRNFGEFQLCDFRPYLKKPMK